LTIDAQGAGDIGCINTYAIGIPVPSRLC
jgi:hypothetical protein